MMFKHVQTMKHPLPGQKTLDEKVADLKEKAAKGEKLTAKEKKMLERHTKEET
jgi:hypothetical protein